MVAAPFAVFALVVFGPMSDVPASPVPGAHLPAPRLVLAGAVVVSMCDGEDDLPRTVIVQGDRITSIIAADSYRFEPGDTLIRADGLWLTPGLSALRVDTNDPVVLRRLALHGVVAVGLSEQSALSALGPLAERPAARLPALRRSPAAAIDAGAGSVVARHKVLLPELGTAMTAGATPAHVLRRLTRDAALALDRPDAGTIAVGCVADLVLLESDPRRDLAALGSIRAVVLRGQLVTRAEIESTEELVEELLASAARAFDGVNALPDWPDAAWHRTFLLRLDGLPRGATRSQVRTAANGAESHVQSVLWSPLHSTTSMSALHDQLGRVVAATVRHDSPADSFEAAFERVGDRWRITVRADDGEQSFIDDAGADRRPPETVVLDLLPTPPDLRRVALQPASPMTIDAAELVYGPTTTTWGAITLATSGAHPSPGRDLVELAVGTWLPPGGLLATIWTGVRANAFPLLATATDRRAALLASRATVAFDESGWLVAAMIDVPDGLWEVHPWDAQKPVPDGLPRGNDVRPP